MFYNDLVPRVPAEHRSDYYNHQHRRRKSLLVLTVDPYVNFNATSQVLRYFALSRAVTVPRSLALQENITRGQSYDSRISTALTPRGALDDDETSKVVSHLTLELSKITLEYEALALKLLEEEHARTENEVKWLAAEERCVDIEQRVREACFEEMEKRLEETKRRWSAALQDQAIRHDEHLARKLDLLTKGFEGERASLGSVILR